MSITRIHPGRPRAFTLVELIVVIVLIAILAGVAIPKYIDYSAEAKEAACRGVLGGVRSAIGNFRLATDVAGAPAYPTLTDMQTTGNVMQNAIQANPYNGSATIVAATWNATPPVSGGAGWNYDATAGRFWANSNTSGVGENAW